MRINWKVRVKNKAFWLAFIPALLVLVQVILNLFDVNWSPEILTDKLIAIVNAVFVVLAIIGVVNDPTTDGIGDSEQAMLYDTPRREE